MKKRILSIVLCLVMVFSLLPFTASAASAIPINEETFPDPVFREYVLKIVGSSVLTEEKARQIEVLDVSASNIKEVLGDRAPITSLMGIRYLRYVKDLNCSGQELKKTLNLEQNSRVEKLNCSGNQLTGLWFHKGSSLKYLTCSVNEFTALDLSKCSELIELSCSSNKLTSLDLSANKKLQKIIAQTNALTTLDTRNLPELTHLYLWGNDDLKSLDVSKNPKLEILSAAHGKLTSLDVRSNRKLVELYVYNNQLTALDVRSNYLLKNLGCYENQITALDLSSNVSLEDLGVNDNPITELDLRAQSNLQKLSCSKMQLKKLDVSRCPKLRRLYCNDNQIETLDLRSNKKLETLYCQNNRLSWLNLSSNTALDPRYVDCSGNVYDIKVDRNLQYRVYPDLPCYGATEGTYFTAARASDWTGGTVSKVDGWDVLTLDNAGVKEVTYKYDTGNARIGKVAFTLKTEVPAKYITISFDPNGGTGTMKPMKVKSGENFTLPECTFTPPEGKEFAGWLAANGTVYPAGDIAFSTTDSVLKATWKDKEAAEVTISFDPNGGTGTMQPVRVKAGVDFTLPECTFTPPAGKEFAGWLAPNGKVFAAGASVHDYNDCVLKATWKSTRCDGGAQCPGRNFSDMPDPSWWSHAGLDYCVQRGILSGVGDGRISPNGLTTRAQFVQMLYSIHGKPAVSGKTPFTDLTLDWYKDAILWAYQTGVTSGTGDKTFGPGDPVTRAQVATFLMKYAKTVCNIKPTWTPADLSKYPDVNEVPGWAMGAMQDAVALGLISGNEADDGTVYLDPNSNATREQVATILMQFCKNVKK